MADNVVNVYGLNNLAQKLDALREFKRSTIVAQMKKASRRVVAGMKRRVKLGPGRRFATRKGKGKTQSVGGGATTLRSKTKHLRETIRAVEGDYTSAKEVHVYVGSRAPHAHLVEYGHALLVNRGKNKGRPIGRVPPYPFARPAADEGAPGMIATFADGMNDVVNQISQDRAES